MDNPNDNRPPWPAPDYSMSEQELRALVREEAHDRPLREVLAGLAKQLAIVAGLKPAKVASILQRAAALWRLPSGGRPGLSREEKLLVLRAVMRMAERDGTPPTALALSDAADYLEELCSTPQPIELEGRAITLPVPLEDHALTRDEVAQRKTDRLRQWLEDALGTKSWNEAKRLLTR